MQEIREILPVTHSKESFDKLIQNESIYSFLLKYLKENRPDEQRNRQLNDIREALYELVDSIDRATTGKESSLLFYTQARLTDFSKLNFSEALGRYLSADAARNLSDPQSDDYKNSLVAQNLALKDLFSIVWTMPSGKSKDLKSILSVATDSDISFSLRAILVSGLIMSLLRVYDKSKFNTLLSIESRSNDEKIKARALTGVALILDKYPDRIGRDEYLKERFEAMADDLTFYTRMREVIYSLAKARGAVSYLNKIKNDLIPDIQKLGPEFLKNLKNEEGEIDMDRLEDNPEWSKMMENSGMEKKLRRLTNMQSSGADMMLSMFEQVSRNFFFNDIDAWFRPFAEWEAERLGLPEELRPMMETLSLNPGICDSDKFAMVSNLRRLPDSAKSFIRSAFEAQARQLSEEVKSMMLHTSTPEFDIETYNYARTLFRFFNFFRLRGEFLNPFEKAQNFKNWPFIGDILAEKEILSAVGEYYYRQGFYEDAITVYVDLMPYDHSDEWNAFCMQKIGCAYEKLNKPDEALRTFLKAFVLAPNDEWLAKKIAKLAVKTQTFTEEIFPALIMLFEKDKDNLEYLLPLAQAEANGWEYQSPEGNRYKFLDRAAYLSPDNHEVVRLQALKKVNNLHNPDASKEALDIIIPLINNAEMYLASLSLSEKIGNEEESKEGRDSEDNILSDLYLAVYLYYLNGEEGESVRMLGNIKTLLKNRFSHREVEINLRKRFPDNEKLRALIEMLPIYIDALSL